jgi:polysaccharide biosynthesis/export protein
VSCSKLFLLLCASMLLSEGCALAPGMSHLLPGTSTDNIRGDADPLATGALAERNADAPEPAVIAITATLIKSIKEKDALTLAQSKIQAQSKNEPRQPSAYRYNIGIGDVISVTVWDHPELTIPAGGFRSAESTGYLVGPDGAFYFPYAGSVHAAGRTVEELRTEVSTRLAKYIERPQIDVRVAGYRSQRVFVTGEVGAKPNTATGGVIQSGILPVTDVPLTALEAINQAGGPTPEADLRRVILTREGQTHMLDLQGYYETGMIDRNWVLQAGDMVYVPDRSYNKVFVMGEVRQPASLQMVKARMTLSEALGETRGLDPTTANSSKIYVIRNAQQRPEIYRLEASSADAMLLSNQFPLRPRDVVYVAATELTRWNRFIQQVLPTIQTLFAPGESLL